MNNLILEENVSLKKYNTFGIGGIANKFFSPANTEELISYIEKEDEYFIIGGGSNVILPDENYKGTIISLKKMKRIKMEKTNAEIDAGITLAFLNNSFLKKGYTDFVWACGIPGTLGGAIIINAGCYGHDIFENLVSIKAYKNGEIIIITKEEIKFGYRYTDLKDLIILSAKFNIHKGDSIAAIENMKNWSNKRLETQPVGTLNAGSTFKNPEGQSAGFLIETAGLKGYNINGASVSEKHANFIVNDGTASSEDIKKLINDIKKEVKRVHNVDLVLENKIVNW